jgi:prevent-host-death family protein
MLINLYEAKTHLSELVEQAARGEDIVIAKAGTSRARLVPVTAARLVRKPGVWKGAVQIADDFDAALPPDVLRGFLGDDD